MTKVIFSAQEIKSGEVTLLSTDGLEQMVVNHRNADKTYRVDWLKEHAAKYDFALNKETGRWSKIRKQSSSVQEPKFNHIIDTSIKLDSVASEPFKVETIRLGDLNVSDNLFDPIRTGVRAFDEFLSSDMGFQRGTSIMLTGEPGAGKTTLMVEMGWKAAANGYRVLFVSAEMGRTDMARYLRRFPHWAQHIDVLFLGEYAYEDQAAAAFEAALKTGYDLVLIDSFTEVCDSVKEEQRLSTGGVEKWFLGQVKAHAEMAKNDREVYTCFVTILQLTKGGNFVGSNKLKHMTTAMCHMRFNKDDKTRRYMEFSKNRVGLVQAKLEYSVFETEITFNELEWETTKLVMGLGQAEEEQKQEEEDLWNEMELAEAESNNDGGDWDDDDEDDMF